MLKTIITFATLIIACFSCQSIKEKEYEEIRKAWTPEVRDSFIEMSKQSGCFDKKVVIDKDGHKISCYCSSTQFDKELDKWVTECEYLCPTEAPECYDGTEPPLSKRCQDTIRFYKDYWDKNQKEVR